ncbi:hypothetical protein Plec18170_001710 [Paecilomyces lecythidis]
MDFNIRSPESSSLQLNEFPLEGKDLKILRRAGSGGAGYVFKIWMNHRFYALKMFKFDNPRLLPSNFKGKQRKYHHNRFFKECRANASLISRGLNGRFTPFCHGWAYVSVELELEVACRFNVQPFLWDRPRGKENDRVQAILFDWISGHMLYDVPLTRKLADQLRSALSGLHSASMAHQDIRAPNILVSRHENRAYFIDLDSSTALPNTFFSQEDLAAFQDLDCRNLEIGFGFCQLAEENIVDTERLGLSLEQIRQEYRTTTRKCDWEWPMPRMRKPSNPP